MAGGEQRSKVELGVDQAGGLRGEPVVGEGCLARWEEDDVWYRAEVVGRTQDAYIVQFFDYGNQAEVNSDRIVQNLLEIPLHDMVDENVIDVDHNNTAWSDPEEVEVLFRPPLFQQRYSLVLEQLAAAGVTRLLDTGCNNCRFLRLLKGLLPGAAYLAGLDLDRELLEAEARVLRPLPGEWLTRREVPLTVELFHGSCGDAAGAGALQDSGVEAVTSIELVEHLDPDTLTTFPAAVLGVIRPRLWVVTTPNSDYNVLFPDFPGPFRHWDHRFEWSRREFQAWAGRRGIKHDPRKVRVEGLQSRIVIPGPRKASSNSRQVAA